jgi:anti-anti-sigma factor
MRGFGVTLVRLPSGAVHVALRGELDLAHAYTFDEELRQVEEEGVHCIVLDLRELSFMDSTGMSRLLSARKRARRDGRRLVVVRGSRAVQRLLALTSMEETFELVNDVPESLRAP